MPECRSVSLSQRWVMSQRIPAVLEQRFKHSFSISWPDLLLVNHLANHLLSDGGQSLLLTVKNGHTLTEEMFQNAQSDQGV